jgi:hypothetical protein
VIDDDFGQLVVFALTFSHESSRRSSRPSDDETLKFCSLGTFVIKAITDAGKVHISLMMSPWLQHPEDRFSSFQKRAYVNDTDMNA